MIMSIDFHILYDNVIFFLKMKYASIILDVFHQNFVVDNELFSFVFAI